MYSWGPGRNGGVLQTPKEGVGTAASVTPSMENNILAGEGKKQKNVTVLKFLRRNNYKMQAFKTPSLISKKMHYLSQKDKVPGRKTPYGKPKSRTDDYSRQKGIPEVKARRMP